MVIPSKSLDHPFSARRPKHIDENVNPLADKPGPVKKPFDNLFSAPSKVINFDPLKRVTQKAGERKMKAGEMEQPNIVSQKLYFCCQRHLAAFYRPLSLSPRLDK
jgi:hypothetical protein